MFTKRTPIPGVGLLTDTERAVLIAVYGAATAPNPYVHNGVNTGNVSVRDVSDACQQVGITVTETYAAIERMSVGGWFLTREHDPRKENTVRLLPNGAALATLLMTER